MDLRIERCGALGILILLASALPVQCVQDPPTQAPASGGQESAEAAPTPDSMPADPQEEVDAIADLLIDGQPREARTAAESLLAEPGLPPRIEARAQQLLTKAEERTAPPPAAPPPPPSPPPLPPFPVATFQVRQARIGEGFSVGDAGTLHIEGAGVWFVATASHDPSWTVPWAHVVDLTQDLGIWDAPYPLVLHERGGPPRYLAVIDDRGDFKAPAALLSAFESARREARKRHDDLWR
jgi:hypothetical protein